MPLTRPHEETVRERAQWDPVYRALKLTSPINFLLGGEVGVGKIALHYCIYATIGYEKLGALIGRTPEDIERMCHPDYDTSVNELFEIIGHLQRHEGVRLEVKVCSGEQGCEAVEQDVDSDEGCASAGQDAAGEPLRNDAYAETMEVDEMQVAVGAGGSD